MKKLCLHPLFLLGLAIRLALIVTTVPLAARDWYVPFLDVSITHFTFDPWSAWLSGGGTPVAFPYGYAMWLAFVPLTIVAKLSGISLLYSYGLTILAADFGLLLVLRELLPERDRLLLSVYWLSPIVLFASYGLGLNDLIPVFILTLSLYFLKRLQLKLSGAVFITAISAKLSMVLALPFVLMYLFLNSALRQRVPSFLAGVLLSVVVLAVPFGFSNAGMQMLFSNPEIGKVYRLVIDLGGHILIYPIPLAYLVMLYLVWRVRRLNFDLVHVTLGMAFLMVVLMTPASPGWFVWAMPLLVTYQAMSGRIGIVLAGMFSGMYLLSSLLTAPLNIISVGQTDAIDMLHLSGKVGNHLVSLLHTAMVATGCILAMRIWRETVSRNDYFRLSRKPFVIGIAGESAAGKDTCSDAIKGLFGDHSVATLSGDDYHLWDRQKPMWQAMTHLNPMANDLEAFTNDLVALTDGKSILARHYDHQTGKMSKPVRIKSNNFIIASGLHALYLPILRECYSLSVYLDIDEGLRRHFKLKRDVHQRGHATESVLSSFERREPDSVRFIRPQASRADLVLSLLPIQSQILDDLDEKNPLRLKLVVHSRTGLNELSLMRVLIGVCGLHVDREFKDEMAEVVFTIEGDTSADDIALAAKMICPRILEFLDLEPKWDGGVIGLMQLIILSHINQALTKRFMQ